MSDNPFQPLMESVRKQTEAVEGSMAKIDENLKESTIKVDRELSKIQTKLPRLIMTKNQELEFEGNYPKSFAINSNVTVTLHLSVEGSNVKSPEAVALLQEVMRDTGFDLKPTSHYRSGFSVIKVAWANSPTWLCYPHSADNPSALSIPKNTFLTLGSFTKLLSGGLRAGSSGSWAADAVLGKWKFCTLKAAPSGFGTYNYLHPIPSTPTGEMLVFLPAAITGHIDNGGEWFPNIKLG